MSYLEEFNENGQVTVDAAQSQFVLQQLIREGYAIKFKVDNQSVTYTLDEKTNDNYQFRIVELLSGKAYFEVLFNGKWQMLSRNGYLADNGYDAIFSTLRYAQQAEEGIKRQFVETQNSSKVKKYHKCV